MAKKLLCVVLSVLMVVSLLPMSIFATETVEIDGTTYEVLFSEDCSIAAGGWNEYLLSGSSDYLTALQTDGALVLITRSNEVSSCTYENIVFVDSWWGNGAVYGTTANYAGSSENTNVAYTFDTGIYVAFDASVVYSHCNSGGTAKVITNTDASYTITNVSVIVPYTAFDYGEEYTILAEEPDDESEYNKLNGLLECLNASGVDFTSSTQYLYIYYTYDAADSTYVGYGPCALCTWDDSGNWVNVIGYGTSYNDIFTVTADGGYFKVPLTTIYEAFVAAGVTDPSGDNIILNWWADLASSGAYATVTKVVVGDTASSTSSSSRNQGVIYINEEYHGIFVTRTIGTTTRKYLVNVPHTVDSTGYCTVCCMYIGSDEEAGTTTIDGVEYEAAYSSDIKLASGSWSAADLGDTSILDALATEGALLVVTRDSEQNIVFSNEETIYEKFVLVNSWYSGDTVQLGTAGHTSADEPDTGIIDCISDDGTTAVYDGNTIYDTWVSNGLNAGGTVLFISNTSSTDYSIANITVYVPAGTVTAEDVDVDEPAEEGETETEDDEAEDLTVDDDTTETPAETNPTTGAVLALVPMAIAGFAVVSSKRR